MTPETPYRLSELERRLEDQEHRMDARLVAVERRTENVNVMQADITRLWGVIHDLGEKVDGLQRAVLTAALSLTVSAIMVCLTIWAVFK